MKFKSSPQWHEGLFRAMNEDLDIQRLRFPPEYVQGGFEVYVVDSSRKDGSVYLVQLHRNSQVTHVICPCNAGRTSSPCKHAALVLYCCGKLVPEFLERRLERDESMAA